MARETWWGKHPGHDEEAAVRVDNARLRAEVARLTREAEEWTVLASAQGLDAQLRAVTQDETHAAWQALRALVAQLVGIVRDMLAVGSYRDLPELIERARAALAAAAPYLALDRPRS